MEKSCENCLHYGHPKCKICKDKLKWKPNYLTLETQLAAANELIKEQIEDLARCREALKSLRQINASNEGIIDKLTGLYWEEHCQDKDCEVEDCLRCILTKAKGG